jgi:hypothetical protein
MLQVNQLHGFNRRAVVAAAPGYDPSIYAYWLDPSDLSSMKQDRTGASATTAAAVDSPVGSWFNKGTAGGWLTAPSDAARPILRQSGALFYLEFDGASNYFSLPATISITTDMTFVRGAHRTAVQDNSGMATSTDRPYEAYWAGDNFVYVALGTANDRLSSVTHATGAYVLTSIRNSTNEIVRKDGSALFTNAAQTVAGSLTLFGRTVIYSSAGYVYGHIFDPTALTGTVLDDAEAYMATQSGL